MFKFTKAIFVFILFIFSTQSVQTQVSFNMVKIGEFFPTGTGGRFSAVWGYLAPDNREYAILGSFNGTYFVDVTDSGNVVEVGFVPSPSPGSSSNAWREMKVYSHYAYMVSEAFNSGVQIVDLQYLPDSVRYVGKYVPPGHTNTHSISQSGPYLYLNGGFSGTGDGIRILDLSQNPEQPVARGSWNVEYVHDSRILNDTIWACNIYSGHVTIINAANKDNPVTITSWLNLPNPFPHNIALTNDRKYAYVTDETSNPPGRLKVWDVQNFSNITLEYTFIPVGFENAIAHNVEIYDTIAVIAYYSAGVKVLNIKNPTQPVEIGWYDTYPQNNNTNFNGCWGVYMFPSGKIIASDRELGLFVLRYSPPVEGVPVANFIASDSNTYLGNPVSFSDLSTGIPSSWEWTITGPQNMSSTIQHPTFLFTQLGQYSVKLRVSNSFGSDSLIKNNYINITGVPMNSFNLHGTTFQSVYTTASDTSKFDIRWTKSTQSQYVNYMVKFKNLTGVEEFVYESNGGGTDTILSIGRDVLYSIANQLNPGGDSARFSVRAWCYNGVDSIQSSNALVLTVFMDVVGISQISEEIPFAYELKQNYPNPFNPSTKINFAIPKNGFVNLKVFDITGKEIATLVSENLQAGFYEYDFDASRLPSGVYFYRIESDEFREVRRMILMK